MSRVAFQPKAALAKDGTSLVEDPPGGTALPGAESAAGGSAGVLREAQRKLRQQWGPDTAERLALLGIILGQLEDVSFEDTAALLGLKAPRLEKWMRGEEAIRGSYVPRWQSLAHILENLHSVLKPSATSKWLHTPIPQLSRRTPFEEMVAGRVARVHALTERYRDSSFS